MQLITADYSWLQRITDFFPWILSAAKYFLDLKLPFSNFGIVNYGYKLFITADYSWLQLITVNITAENVPWGPYI